MNSNYNDYMAPLRQKPIPTFPEYTGSKAWSVTHPTHGTIMVIAPSVPAAIATAASAWNRRWQAYDFYADCKVVPQKTERKK